MHDVSGFSANARKAGWRTVINFVVPEANSPTGGINIIIQFAEVLLRNGRDVRLIFETPDYVYSFIPHDVPTAYVPHRQSLPLKGRIKSALKLFDQKQAMPRSPGANPLAMLDPSDIFIIPEYAFDLDRARFPVGKHVILVQGFGPLFDCLVRMAPEHPKTSNQFLGAIATSQKCAEATKVMIGQDPAVVPLALDPARYVFRTEKKKQIAYMPRRRGEEIAGLIKLLSTQDALRDFNFVPIDGMPSDQVDQILSDSLIYLSGSQKDGFGLPPAEAMAMGCLVVGYTGVGGTEFFTPQTGFPVPDDDLVTFYQTVRDVVTGYQNDPAPYDILRQNASQFILERYSLVATEDALLQAFKELQEHWSRT